MINQSMNSCVHYKILDLRIFQITYDAIHVHLVLLICPVGLIFNILNTIVLNQKSMKSPTNFLLTLLAISDGTIMALYIVFDIKYLKNNELDKLTWNWAHYLFFYLSMQNILHSFSSWNLVALALFRLIYIRYPHHAIVHCTMIKAKIAGSIIFVASILISIPYFLAHEVTTKSFTDSHYLSSQINKTLTSYFIDYVNPQMEKVIFLWTSIFVKSLPITLMTTLTIILITALRKSVLRRATLLNYDHFSNASNKPSVYNARPNILQRRGGITKETINHVNPLTAKKSIKTTRMLIFIVIIYCLSYLPQALMLLATGILGHCFSVHVYDRMGNLMDLITLLNACVNFILFCSMSSQYRQTFTELFLCQKKSSFSCGKLKISQQMSSVIDFQSNYNNYINRQKDGHKSNSLAICLRPLINFKDVQRNRYSSFAT